MAWCARGFFSPSRLHPQLSTEGIALQVDAPLLAVGCSCALLVQNCGRVRGFPVLLVQLQSWAGLGTAALSMFLFLFMAFHFCLVSVGGLGGRELPAPPSVAADLFFVSVQDSGPESPLFFHQGRTSSISIA